MKLDSIAIIGVGRLGGNLAQELIRFNIFSKIYLYNRSLSRLESMVLSLRVYASFVNSQTEIIIIDDLYILDVGAVVIAIKENYDPRTLLETELLPSGLDHNVRTIGIKKDMPLLRDICDKLFNYTGKIIILTNPVDIFTVLVKRWIPNSDVYGFGVTLDSARLAYSAQRHGFKCFAHECLLGGAHIGELVQLISLWNQHNPFLAQIELELDNLLQITAKIGPAIVHGLGYTLHDCSAVFSKDIAWLVGKDTTRKYLCASVGNDSAATAWPLKYSKETSGFEIYDSLTENELRQLDNSANQVGDAVHVVDNM